MTVPVRHEEARMEREQITEAIRDEATSGPEICEAEHEVTLHEERPVVETKAEPEQVRLTTEEETVKGKVRQNPSKANEQTKEPAATANRSAERVARTS
jgi:hypothetical protein